MRISTVVAASAAYPVFLSPVTLQNFAGTPCQAKINNQHFFTSWQNVVRNTGTYDEELYDLRRAYFLNDLRKNPSYHSSNIDYLRLVDGGLSDNLGIRALIEEIAYSESHEDILIEQGHAPPNSPLLYHLYEGDITKLVIIIVNARSDPKYDSDATATSPGILDTFEKIVGISIDSASDDIAEQITSRVSDLANATRWQQMMEDLRKGSYRAVKRLGVRCSRFG